MEHKYYILDKDQIKEVDINTWAVWMDKKDRGRVDYTKLSDKINVSTVFLSLDHNWSDKGNPILFETMVFGGKNDGYMRRYSTLEEAKAGHQEVVYHILKHEPKL